MAEAHGATGMRVKSKQEVTSALKKAFATEGPVTVRVRTDPELV